MVTVKYGIECSGNKGAAMHKDSLPSLSHTHLLSILLSSCVFAFLLCDCLANERAVS